jgi:uncharacterized protein (DUF2062 family)
MAVGEFGSHLPLFEASILYVILLCVIVHVNIGLVTVPLTSKLKLTLVLEE